MTNTSPRFNVKGNAFEMASSPTFGAEVQQRMALIEWINSAVPNFCLSLKASDEELRASLLDGDLLSQILQRLKYSSNSEGDDSSPSTPVRRRKILRFIAAMSDMGLPSFELMDLEKGSMRPVLDSLIALKEHTKKHFGSPVLITVDDRRPPLSEIKFQRSYSLLSPESPTTLLHGGNKFHEVFQMQQGLYADLPATKISEMVKSSSLDNAPTQSLLSVINGILDESIEKKNAEIPQGVACLLRKVVQEIERRIATQGEHLRTQSSMFKAREEKYQSRIKVLEALAKGTTEESEIAMNQLQYLKSERSKMDDKKRSEQKKRFIDKDDDKFKKLKDETNAEVLKLNMELEIAKRTYELRIHDLKTEAKQLHSELENKLRHQEKLVEDSKAKMKERELKWTKKERTYEKIVDFQLLGLEELRRSSVSIKQEVSRTQKMYLQELNHLGEKLKSLTKSAQSYHDVLNENRKLYNELQDLKGNIRVFVRVRPHQPGEDKKQSIIEEIGEHGEMTVVNPAKPKDSQKSFRFNKVYGSMATQAEVFADTQPLIRTILDGYNVCIFAYGQTGSGKTYTMSGPHNTSKEDWGVNYRALDDLFQVSEDRKNCFLYEIGVQMIEIYNEQIRDLLANDGSQKKLEIMTATQRNGLVVPDASMHTVRSTKDVIDLMNIGLANRSVSATAMNERSSRSHSLVTIHVRGTELKSGVMTYGSLHLVDLAGSERVDRSEAVGDRLKEAQHINKSLSSLGDVIFALAQKSPHVPYRNSKLTQVLQTSLGGRAKTLMFVQVNPDVTSYTESLSTLKFAERVSGVELGAARNNKEGKDVKELMDQVASLKDTMSKKDKEIGRLLRDPRSPSFSIQPSPTNTSSRGSPSSPSTRPTTSGPRTSSTLTRIRRPGILHKSFDSLPDGFDPSTQYATEETENEGIRPSRSLSDMKGGRRFKRPGGISMDDDLLSAGVGDGDEDDDRCSEVSGGDVSVGTNESDGSLEGIVSPDRPKSSDSHERRREKLKTPTRHSQSKAPTGASRLSQTLKADSAPKKPGGGQWR